MNKNNILYKLKLKGEGYMERVDGLTILKMCKAKNFKEGDILIAFQKIENIEK